ncbi:hypothetical protein FACS189490_10910 [Clostridia bacterium]|nr:hypothetical protein FACS189490_10910 [Clostridia bacterium]
MINRGLVKIIGTTLTIVSMGVTLISAWVDDRMMDEKIDEKLKEAFAEQENKNEEES